MTVWDKRLLINFDLNLKKKDLNNNGNVNGEIRIFHTGIIQSSLPEELDLPLVEIYEKDFLLKLFFKTRNI